MLSNSTWEDPTRPCKPAPGCTLFSYFTRSPSEALPTSTSHSLQLAPHLQATAMPAGLCLTRARWPGPWGWPGHSPTGPRTFNHRPHPRGSSSPSRPSSKPRPSMVTSRLGSPKGPTSYWQALLPPPPPPQPHPPMVLNLKHTSPRPHFQGQIAWALLPLGPTLSPAGSMTLFLLLLLLSHTLRGRFSPSDSATESLIRRPTH